MNTNQYETRIAQSQSRQILTGIFLGSFFFILFFV